MKFSDGYWLMREGVQASYPAQVRDVEAGAGTLTIHAPVRRIRHRGDTLEGPLVTVRLESPLPDVVGVSITHWSGGPRRGPQFPLLADGAADVTTGVDARHAWLTSGRLSARVDRDAGWALHFEAEGRILTASGSKAMALIETDAAHYVREQLDLGVGTHVYGLGERFTPFVRNGQSVDMWNADGGTSSEQAYKNVPFLFTDSGWGVFVDSPGRVSFEVASELVSRVGFSLPGQSLRYFLIYGPTPKEILRRYTALTGRPALPPAWSFGLWLSTSFTTSYDEATVTSFVDGMAERDLPLSVFHFDCFWMREYHWCDFVWDPEVFPDPRGMLERLKAKGLRICVWINPYIAQRSSLFAEGKELDYLLRRPDGTIWQWDRWQPGMALVDFTNSDARGWYAGKLRELLDMGVDCFATDFGERIPTDVAYADGSDPEVMHNFYTYLYNATVFELLRAHRGDGEAVLFARSATACGQSFPVHWGGDCESTFASMAETLRGGLSLAASGFGFWSHDIGGFEGTPDTELFKRWIAFGLLSSHSRLHGSDSYRVPWLFDEEAVDVLRTFTRLKCRLMPYLFAAACRARDEGLPVMRPMVLEFPDDPACTHLDRQYMLGGDLLVAPVMDAGGFVTYYVPTGIWTHLLSGGTVTGPRWVSETHDVFSVPLLARPGAVIATGAGDDRPDYDYREGVTLEIHSPADGDSTRVVVPTVTGDVACTFDVSLVGGVLSIRGTDAPGRWRALLVGAAGIASVTGGAVSTDPRGTMLSAMGAEMTVRLSADRAGDGLASPG